MSFPVVSRVLNGFKDRLRMQTFFGYPQRKKKKRKRKKNQRKREKKNTQKRLSYPMELPQEKKLKTKKKKDEQEEISPGAAGPGHLHCYSAGHSPGGTGRGWEC